MKSFSLYMISISLYGWIIHVFPGLRFPGAHFWLFWKSVMIWMFIFMIKELQCTSDFPLAHIPSTLVLSISSSVADVQKEMFQILRKFNTDTTNILLVIWKCCLGSVISITVTEGIWWFWRESMVFLALSSFELYNGNSFFRHEEFWICEEITKALIHTIFTSWLCTVTFYC